MTDNQAKMQKNGHLNLSIWILFEGSFALTVSAGVGEADGQVAGVDWGHTEDVDWWAGGGHAQCL